MVHGGRGRERGGSEIEFLAPDRQAFATSSADGFVDVGDDRPDQFDDDLEARSPLKALATTAIVLALFAGGLVLAAPWKTDPAEPAAVPETTATSTTTTTTILVDATTEEILIDGTSPSESGGYVSTAPPQGFEVAGQFSASEPIESGWVELRASPGARRTSGQWLAAQLVHDRGELERPGARRVELGDKGVGLYRRSADGVAELTFHVTPGIVGTLTGGGWTEFQLVAIAAGLGHIGVRPVYASTLANELDVVGSMRTDTTSLAEVYAFGDARAGLIYRRRSDDRFIQIRVSSTDPFLDSLAEFVLVESADFPFSGPAVRISINGRNLTGGTLPELDDARIARWNDGDGSTVSVVSNLDMVDLLDVVASVEGASAQAWGDAMREARDFGPATPSGVKTNGAGEGVLADGSSWRVDIDASGSVVTLVADGHFSTQFLGPDDPPLHVFSTTRATVVMAIVSSMAGAGQVLHVDAPAGPVDVALQPAGAIGTPWVAVHVFSEPGPFAASVIDGEGVVLEQFLSDPDAPSSG